MGCCEAKPCSTSHWESLEIKHTHLNENPDLAPDAYSRQANQPYPTLMISLGKQRRSLSSAREEALEKVHKLAPEETMEIVLPSSHHDGGDSQEKVKYNVQQNDAGPVNEQTENMFFVLRKVVQQTRERNHGRLMQSRRHFAIQQEKQAHPEQSRESALGASSELADQALVLGLGKQEGSPSSAKDKEAPEKVHKLAPETAKENVVLNWCYKVLDNSNKTEDNKNKVDNCKDTEEDNGRKSKTVLAESGTLLQHEDVGLINTQMENGQSPRSEKNGPADQNDKPRTFDAVAEALRDPASAANLLAFRT